MGGYKEVGFDHLLCLCEEPSLVEVMEEFEAFVALEASDLLLRDGLLQMQRLLLQWLLWPLLILLLFFLLGSVKRISYELLFVLSLHPLLVRIVDFRLLFGRSVGIGAKVLLFLFVTIAPLELQLVISFLRDLSILLAAPLSAL